MNRFPRFAPFALLALAVLISTAGCKSNQNATTNGQTAADANQAAPPDSSSDPAAANLAPVSATTSTATSPAPAPQQSAPPPSAPADSGNYDQASDQTNDASYGEPPVESAPQPPPALPEYEQPPSPGDGYLWTPGYWNYASAGYYWVPGVWVQAPYQGALWTPGYWGWTGGHYGFFRGYWGQHIGFYGGVNYGFGYVGTGYQGGYWNGNNFYYNRAVNNVNVTVIHNVYNRTVVVNNNVRVSFNGGQGGVQVRPRPAELVALREPHAPPMRAQVQIERAAVSNKANFVAVNHGRPANPVIAKPLVADRDVHPVAPPSARNMPTPRNAMEARPNAAPTARANEPNRAAPARPEPARPQQTRPEAKPNAPARSAEPSRPAQQRPAPPARPETAAPRPAAHPQPKPEEHAAPSRPKPEAHPVAPKPAPEKKPEEKRPEQ
jgi:hypothetical protein